MLKGLYYDIKNLAHDLRYLSDALELANRISEMPSCNDCNRKDCEYKPKWGKPVRYNCPLWEGEKKDGNI